MIGIVSLHDDAPRQLAAAGAAADLRHELEDPLGRAKVGHRERVIAAHHAHQRDAVNVVPFGDHLRADQQIDFARMQTRQQPLEIVPAAHRVAIHAADARSGKDLLQPLFALLRAGAEVVQVLALAFGASRRHSALEAAVVALQPLSGAGQAVFVIGLVMRECDRAVLALELFAAGAADHGEGIAAAVEQDQRLLAALERRLVCSTSAREKSCSWPVS